MKNITKNNSTTTANAARPSAANNNMKNLLVLSLVIASAICQAQSISSGASKGMGATAGSTGYTINMHRGNGPETGIKGLQASDGNGVLVSTQDHPDALGGLETAFPKRGDSLEFLSTVGTVSASQGTLHPNQSVYGKTDAVFSGQNGLSTLRPKDYANHYDGGTWSTANGLAYDPPGALGMQNHVNPAPEPAGLLAIGTAAIGIIVRRRKATA